MRIRENISLVFIGTLIFLGILVFSPKLSNAQFEGFSIDPTVIKDTDIDVALVPEVPGPNQNVKMYISSYYTNVNKAVITWSLNGKESVSGTGKTTFSFTTGDIGTTTEVGIIMIVEEGTRVDKKLLIVPSQVDLLWEAPNSYVPPFYKGKALAIKESKVRIVALPVEKDGSVNPTTKVYNWKKNNKVDQGNSGYGKYSFVITNAYVNVTDTVELGVSGGNGGAGVATLPINYTDAKIMVYEKNPAYGLLLNRLLNNGFSLTNGEMTVSAEPFYFSKYKDSVTEKNMQYRWIINGTLVTPPEKSNELTLRGSANNGTANISIAITNISTLFQEAKQALSVTLGR